MKLSIEKRHLMEYIIRQLDFYLPDDYIIDKNILENSIDVALKRCEVCFSHILLPGYHDNVSGEVAFSHLHMDQYATFIYFLGNTIWENYQQKHLCDKLLNLNRILNGFFLSYKCPMPSIFILAHPVGSVIGNAIYSDGLYISQNVTINTHTDSKGKLDLEIGRGCFLGAGAKIIGNKRIGDRVSIGVDTVIYNKEIDDDKVCIKEEDGRVVVKDRKSPICMAQKVFDIDLYDR